MGQHFDEPLADKCLFHLNFSKNFQRKAQEDFENRLRNYSKMARIAEQDDSVYRLPYIVHVVHGGEPIGIGTNLDARQVYSQIEATNADLRRRNSDTALTRSMFAAVSADTKIELVPALYAPDGTPLEEPGIHRYNGGKEVYSFDEVNNIIKAATSWNPNQYLNIWSVRFYVGSSESTLGYSTFPFAPSAAADLTMNFPPHEDGVFIHYKVFGSRDIFPGAQLKSVYTKGRTLTHELGHFLGLYHVWGDDYNCNGTDYCDDTPTSQRDYNQLTCPSSSMPSCEANKLDMWENFLFYSPDACMNLFTRDQKNRMRRVLEFGTRRSSLLTSPVATPREVTANFKAVREVCRMLPVSFEDKSFVANSSDSIVNWWWNFQGGIPATSTVRNPIVVYPHTGRFDVRLVVQTQSGKRDTLLRTQYIAVTNYEDLISSNDVLLSENFSSLSSQLPVGWQSIASNTWVYASQSATEHTSGSVMVDNFNTSLAEQRNKQMYLFSPFMRTDAETLFIDFQFAHSLAPARTNFDTLVVMLRNVCTHELHQILKMGGNQLVTAPSRSNFSPSSSAEWRSIGTIFRTQRPAVWQLIFQNLGNRNNRIFLDNITVKTAGNPAHYILAYPNPTSGDLIIQTNLVIYTMRLYTLEGRLLNEYSCHCTLEQLDFSTVPNGIYMLLLETSEGKKYFKISVMK